MSALRVLIVDDEALARQRLRTLLERLSPERPTCLVGEAASAGELLVHPALHACDLILLDISLPGTDGLMLARTLRAQAVAAELVFVTAHDAHALAAFELDARDYLLKPVRTERLAEALARVATRLPTALPQRDARPGAAVGSARALSRRLRVQQRGILRLVAFDDILFLRADQKYVQLHSRVGEGEFEGSLSQLERDHPDEFLRIHRKCLVRAAAVAALERTLAPDGQFRWWIRLDGLATPLAVSRRQLASVRDALSRAGQAAQPD